MGPARASQVPRTGQGWASGPPHSARQEPESIPASLRLFLCCRPFQFSYLLPLANPHPKALCIQALSDIPRRQATLPLALAEPLLVTQLTAAVKPGPAAHSHSPGASWVLRTAPAGPSPSPGRGWKHRPSTRATAQAGSRAARSQGPWRQAWGRGPSPAAGPRHAGVIAGRAVTTQDV